MRLPLLLAVTIFGGGNARLLAATVLFDFETNAEVKAWHDEGRSTLGPGKELRRVTQFATSGKSALQFFTPAWKEGKARWPAFECQPPVTDWSKFDRLVMDVTNTSPAAQRLSLFISDSKKPTRSGLLHRALLPPLSYTQVVIDVRKGFREKRVNARDIHVMHFFTAEPPVDLRVYLDRLTLLEPGQPLPTVPQGYLAQFAAIQAPAIDALAAFLQASRDKTLQATADAPDARQWMTESLDALEQKLSVLRTLIARPDRSVLDIGQQGMRLRSEVARLESLLVLRQQFEKIRPAVQVAGASAKDLTVAFASSMEKVLPDSTSMAALVHQRVELALARNEEESLQVIVIPFRHDVKQVQVRVSDLHGRDGAVLTKDNIDGVVVGYVQTKAEPPYGSEHVGWWPDPILDFQKTADIAKHHAQAFWIRVHAPKGQASGTYQGKLEITVQGKPLLAFDLAVRVYDFDLPDTSPLPLAVTFAPHDHPTAETRAEQAEWRKSEDYPVNAWKKHRLQWADFLADYYLTYDSLYSYQAPDFELLVRLDRQGRLGRFNLGYYGACGEAPSAIENWKDKTLARLRPAYEKAKSLGLLDRAYIYGCDEAPAKLFPNVQRAAALLKAEFPDVQIMTTTYDHSYGQESVIKAVDAWCPLTARFDMTKAAKARADGKQVWWYICCGPHHPYANMFVEYPAIDGRLLMGVMTAKYRPDGFLYYQISIWNSRRPIEHGPFTDWDPRSWTTYHGDGSWTCVGPDGTPLPTIRLENFRDGLEDYAYFRILQATVAKVDASPQLRAQRAGWLTEAKARLAVPPELVKSLKEYARDPVALYRYRNGLAEAIETAGIRPEP